MPNWFCVQGDDGAGHIFKTTRVVQVKGNIITTSDGVLYRLDNAAPQYVEYCKQMDWYVPTLDAPILVTKK